MGARAHDAAVRLLALLQQRWQRRRWRNAHAGWRRRRRRRQHAGRRNRYRRVDGDSNAGRAVSVRELRRVGRDGQRVPRPAELALGVSQRAGRVGQRDGAAIQRLLVPAQSGVRQAYCGAPYNGDTAAQWGAEQANQLLQALAALPSHISPYLTATLADIEWEKVSPYSDGTPCPANSDNCSGPLNYGYWYRDPTHQSENVAVIDGFMNAVCNAGYCENGAYTSTFNWTDITGFVPPSAIDGASFIQIASWDASAATIQSEEEQFTNQQYAIYSWQFNLTNPAGSGCVYPDLNLATAQTYAHGAAPPIPRVDIWTISAVNVVC